MIHDTCTSFGLIWRTDLISGSLLGLQNSSIICIYNSGFCVEMDWLQYVIHLDATPWNQWNSGAYCVTFGVWSRPVPPLSLLPLSGGALPAEHGEPAKHQSCQCQVRTKTNQQRCTTEEPFSISHVKKAAWDLRKLLKLKHAIQNLKHSIAFSSRSLPQQPAAPLLPSGAAPVSETSAANASKCLFPSNVATDQIWPAKADYPCIFSPNTQCLFCTMCFLPLPHTMELRNSLREQEWVLNPVGHDHREHQ